MGADGSCEARGEGGTGKGGRGRSVAARMDEVEVGGGSYSNPQEGGLERATCKTCHVGALLQAALPGCSRGLRGGRAEHALRCTPHTQATTSEPSPNHRGRQAGSGGAFARRVHRNGRRLGGELEELRLGCRGVTCGAGGRQQAAGQAGHLAGRWPMPAACTRALGAHKARGSEGAQDGPPGTRQPPSSNHVTPTLAPRSSSLMSPRR